MTAALLIKERLMPKCMCGAYDCGACYPATYKKYIAQEENDEEQDEGSGQDDEYGGHDEDYIRYLNEGRER